MQNSRPSDTARLIARSIILASRDRKLRPLVAEGEAEAFDRILTSAYQRDWILRVLRLAVGRWVFLRAERFLLPGIITHYLVRKRQIEFVVRKAIKDGCKRLVVLGAGYDTLAWRLHREHPDVNFIELDHPATQQLKQGGLGNASNLCYRPVDFASQLPSSVLPELAKESSGPTIFVIEGLTMYLPPTQVASLIQDLSVATEPNSRIVFTFMEDDGSGSIGFRGANPLVDRWLKARSEPFLWGISRSELPPFLKSNGAEFVELADHQILREKYLSPHRLDSMPLAEGELICTAAPLSQ